MRGLRLAEVPEDPWWLERGNVDRKSTVLLPMLSGLAVSKLHRDNMRKCVSSGTLISLQAAQDFRREGVMGKKSFEVLWKGRMVIPFMRSSSTWR